VTDAKPTYRARKVRYEIDHCGPQNLAIQKGKIEFRALTKGHYPGTPVPENILPGLNSIGFWDAGGPQDWGLDEHRNEGVEIVFLETGSMAFTADEKKFKLQAGHFTITRPWQLHKLGAPNIGPGRLHWLILDVGVRRPHQSWRWPKWVVLTGDDLLELTRKLRHNENPVWHSNPALAQTFRDIARAVAKWDQPHAVSRLTAHLNQLLIGILDVLSEQQTHENEQLTTHRHTAELFLRDLEQGRVNVSEPWTLERMAKQCGMGVTAFSKYSREIVNAGPMEYLNACRLDRAAEKLANEPGQSVTDIAFACGFNSSQYFATRFRQRFQCSPTRFVAESGNSKK
jgi:AraC family L-rhamnose operon regulatory protein RhaS